MKIASDWVLVAYGPRGLPEVFAVNKESQCLRKNYNILLKVHYRKSHVTFQGEIIYFILKTEVLTKFFVCEQLCPGYIKTRFFVDVGHRACKTYWKDHIKVGSYCYVLYVLILAVSYIKSHLFCVVCYEECVMLFFWKGYILLGIRVNTIELSCKIQNNVMLTKKLL